MLEIRPLEKALQREGFNCGVERIDNYLTKTALQEHKKYKMRVFVGTLPESFNIVGFYTLTFIVWALEEAQLDAAVKEKFAKTDKPVPAIYLAKLGVDQKHTKKGYGAQLMRDAFNRCIKIAENAAISTLTLQAIDEDKAKWYEKLGFQRFSPGSLDMVISLATLRQAAS